MTEPNLKDPRKLFYSDGFPQQDQETPHYRTKWSLNQIVGKTAMSEITN